MCDNNACDVKSSVHATNKKKKKKNELSLLLFDRTANGHCSGVRSKRKSNVFGDLDFISSQTLCPRRRDGLKTSATPATAR